MMSARWWSTMSATAVARLWSMQSLAPTYRTFAPGAIEWTASTSSDCSPIQPDASHLSAG